MEAMGLKFTPVVVRHLLGPLSVFGPAAGTFFHGLMASTNSPNGGCNLPPAAHPLSPPTPPPYTCHS